jgi:hypothetical protein
MNLYRVSIPKTKGRYGYYDSAIVRASNESDAKSIHPNGQFFYYDGRWHDPKYPDVCFISLSWAEPHDIKVELIGSSSEPDGPPTVTYSSFNAG